MDPHLFADFLWNVPTNHGKSIHSGSFYRAYLKYMQLGMLKLLSAMQPDSTGCCLQRQSRNAIHCFWAY